MSDATDGSHIIDVIISIVSVLRKGASSVQYYNDGEIAASHETTPGLRPDGGRQLRRSDGTVPSGRRRRRLYSTIIWRRRTTVRSRKPTRAAAERRKRALDTPQQWIREDGVCDTCLLRFARGLLNSQYQCNIYNLQFVTRQRYTNNTLDIRRRLFGSDRTRS